MTDCKWSKKEVKSDGKEDHDRDKFAKEALWKRKEKEKEKITLSSLISGANKHCSPSKLRMSQETPLFVRKS